MGLIDKYKNIRKQSYLKRQYKFKYAFVGIGSHSINNLYPVLNYLGVPLKYIVTKSEANAATVSDNFNGVQGTTDLSKVLSDDEIGGVFVCSSPAVQFEITKQILESGKKVFVEKPPCLSITELNELVGLSDKTNCVVGLQKRYAPVFELLRKKVRGAASYTYKYHTGPYPEGNPVFDLFIHPIDLINSLFGDASIVSTNKVSIGAGVTYLINVEHANGIVGSLELSTAYSWSAAKEEMCVNTKSGIYTVFDTDKLVAQSKSPTVMGIPLEKVMKVPETSKVLYNTTSFVPIKENNQLYTQGYYNELKTFVDICEGKKAKNISAPADLVNTFKLLEELS